MTDEPAVPAAVPDQSGEARHAKTLSRRKALARLGIAAGIAYTAPTIVRLDRSANAKALPTPCPPPGSKGGGAPWCR